VVWCSCRVVGSGGGRFWGALGCFGGGSAFGGRAVSGTGIASTTQPPPADRPSTPAPERRLTPTPIARRGWMWSSGYVVVPIDATSCTVNISLQVDPKVREAVLDACHARASPSVSAHQASSLTHLLALPCPDP